MYAIITIWQCTRILIETHVNRNGPTSSPGNESQRLSSDLPSQRTTLPVKIYRYFRSKYVSVLEILTYIYIYTVSMWQPTALAEKYNPQWSRSNKSNKNTKHNGPYNLQKKKFWRLQNNVKLKPLFRPVLPDTWNSTACRISFPRFAHLSFR